VYTGCRQYGASSTISFDESEAAPAAAPSRHAETVPKGLVVLTSLATPIDLARGAVGDEVTLISSGDARRGGFTVPKGAVIRGRIIGMTVNLSPDREVALQMRTTSLERNRRQIPFHARLTGAKSREELTGTKNWLELHKPIGEEPVLKFDAADREVFPKGVLLTWRTVGE
jgi:hypothetical protein